MTKLDAENKKAIKSDPGGKIPRLLVGALPHAGSESGLMALLALVSTPSNASIISNKDQQVSRLLFSRGFPCKCDSVSLLGLFRGNVSRFYASMAMEVSVLTDAELVAGVFVFHGFVLWVVGGRPCNPQAYSTA